MRIVEVTDVRLRRVNTDGRMRAIASITFDGEFVIHDIRVIDVIFCFFVVIKLNIIGLGYFSDIVFSFFYISVV